MYAGGGEKKMVKSSPRMEPRRASYVCGPLLARVAVARVGYEEEVGPRRFELRTSAV
jgi:hypothetical protein